MPEETTIRRVTRFSSSSETVEAKKIIPKLLGDGRRFKQVLINLVKNALKFTSNGKIEILASYRNKEDDYSKNMLIIHVKDTGRGILPEDIPKLFTEFGKLQKTADINAEGIGLGLTIVKQIVETS